MSSPGAPPWSSARAASLEPAGAAPARVSPAFATTLTLALFLLLLTAGSALQALSVYPGLLATELGLLLLPTWLACRYLGLSPRQALMLGPGRGSWPGSAPILGVLAFLMALGLTLPLLLLLVLAGGRYPGLPLPLATTPDYLLALAAGAVAAPICEEILFRGFLLRALGGHGVHAAVWVGAALFGVFHMDPVRFVPTMALGVVYGYLAAGTGSVRPSMVAHGVNNGIALTLAWLGGGGGGGGTAVDLESMRAEMEGALAGAGTPVPVELALLVAAAVLAVGGLVMAALVAWLVLGIAGPRPGRWAALRFPETPAQQATGLARLPALWGMAMAAGLVWAVVLWGLFAGDPAAGTDKKMPEPEPSGIPGGEVTEFWSVPSAPVPAVWSVSLSSINTAAADGAFRQSVKILAPEPRFRP